jgi:acetyl-CoA carboxylase biotin carboxyl carrier protein
MKEETVAEIPPDLGGLLDAVCRQVAQLGATTSSPVRRLRIEAGGASLEVEWASAAAVRAGEDHGPAPRAVAKPAPLPAAPPGEHQCHLTAPAVGTFYRAPAPGAPPFVQPGDEVKQGQQIAILEAMKLMSAIVAEEAATVVEVLAEDGTPVEYGQPLFLMAPLGVAQGEAG